jgi:hypothetical protein
MDLLSRDNIDYTVNGVDLGEIANYNEHMVLAVMRRMSEDGRLPTTSVLLEDIYVLALNMLPARYIQPTSITVYRERYAPPLIEVQAAVLRATRKVMSNPTQKG